MTAEILAMLATVNRDPKKHPEPFYAHEFNPFAPPQRKEKSAQLPPRQFVQAVGDAVKAGNAKSR
jgi:hypothetical protein